MAIKTSKDVSSTAQGLKGDFKGNYSLVDNLGMEQGSFSHPLVLSLIVSRYITTSDPQTRIQWDGLGTLVSSKSSEPSSFWLIKTLEAMKRNAWFPPLLNHFKEGGSL